MIELAWFYGSMRSFVNGRACASCAIPSLQRRSGFTYLGVRYLRVGSSASHSE
jgi:hypothetical protein